MQHPFLAAASVALALALGASGAFAFTTVTSSTSTDSKANARLADPDELMNNMANEQSSGGTRTMHFGGATLQLNGPGAASRSPFLPSPAAQGLPAFQGR
jgi:hypothetical protein